ncbi:hypothetical protein ABPG72_021445 [Tetrahymena utriculariae]
MAKGRKFFLQKANVMVCNTSGIFIVFLAMATFAVHRYAFQARAITTELPYDYIIMNEVSGFIPYVGFKVRQINVDQQIHNTTSLYHHLDQLNYTKTTFNNYSQQFFMLSVRMNQGKKKKFGVPNIDMLNSRNISQNGLGLAQNLMNLIFTAGRQSIALKNKQNEFEEEQQYIFTYYRKETDSFVSHMNDHYNSSLEEYFLKYYIFVGFKLFLYFILIFRMYSAISILNKVLISFEEYSISKRGFLLFLLFVIMIVSTVLQVQFFNEFGHNTSSTTSLSTSLINRYKDIQFASDYIFESVILGSVKIYDYNEVIQNVLSKVEQNDDRIYKTTKGSVNVLSKHFQPFLDELKVLQNSYKCNQYFEYLFKLEGCSEFCETTLVFYNDQKQRIDTPSRENYQTFRESGKFLCALPQNENGKQGIQNQIKALKQLIQQKRGEWDDALVNDSQDQQSLNKTQRAIQFMNQQYLKFPESSLYNIKLHNDYLLKLLSKCYKDYLDSFDFLIYIYIYLDLIVGTIFVIIWGFYYFYLTKGLTKHKSKFEELKAGGQDE